MTPSFIVKEKHLVIFLLTLLYLNNSIGISLITHSKVLKCLVYLRRIQVLVNLFFHIFLQNLIYYCTVPICSVVQMYGPQQKPNTNKKSQSNLIQSKNMNSHHKFSLRVSKFYSFCDFIILHLVV